MCAPRPVTRHRGDGIMMTQAMRDAVRTVRLPRKAIRADVLQAQIGRYERVTARIYFPNRLVLQGVFHPSVTLLLW